MFLEEQTADHCIPECIMHCASHGSGIFLDLGGKTYKWLLFIYPCIRKRFDEKGSILSNEEKKKLNSKFFHLPLPRREVSRCS